VSVAASALEMVVTWTNTSGKVNQIYATIYSILGKLIRAPFLVDSDPNLAPCNAENPSVAVLRTGDFVIVWNGKSLNNLQNYQIYASLFHLN